jgi:hypothetical protein
MLSIALLTAALASSGEARVSTATAPISVDGRLDEEDWSRCQPLPELERYIPAAGGPPPGQTRICLLQDSQHLYLGVEVSQAPAPPRANLSPRESLGTDDRVILYLDPDGLGITGYRFEINPLGVQADAMLVEGEVFDAWDVPFTSAGVADEGGYRVEAAIPFRFLGASAGADQRWGLIAARMIASEGATYAWPRLERTHTNLLSLAGPLVGVAPEGVGAGLVLAPSLMLKHALAREEEGSALARDGGEGWWDTARPGLDARARLGPGLEIAGTLLPDFSQVGADVALVDLNQRFAVRYPERRPFFLAGLEAFVDGPGTLYTRSIVEPTFGLKASGSSGPLRAGALYADDISPYASVHERGTPGFTEEELEGARAHTAAVRLRDELGGGSFVGVTAASKRVYGADLPAFSTNLGVDGGFRFGRYWSLSGWGAASSAGRPDDILSGGAGELQFERRVDTGLSFKVRSYASSSDYRREMGYLTQTGLVYLGAWLEHGVDGRGASSWTRGLGVIQLREQSGDGKAEVYHFNKVTLSGTHTLDVRGGYVGYREEGVAAPGGYGKVAWAATGSDRWSPSLSGEVAREIDYDLLVPAAAVSGDAGIDLQATSRLRLNLKLAGELFQPEGQALERGARVYSVLGWQLRPELGLRLIQQTQTGSSLEVPKIDASALLTWMPEPGREAYLGVTWDAEPRGDGLQEQVVFFKVTHAFWL